MNNSPTNDSLVERILISPYHPSPSDWDEDVIAAIRAIDRREFIPPDSRTLVMAADINPIVQLGDALSKDPDADNAQNILDEALFYFSDLHGRSIPVEILSRDFAYANSPLDIGHNQTCSEPALVARMSELLDLQQGMRVYEFGSGCGYHAAITLSLIGEQGKLVTVEYVPELAQLASQNLLSHFGNNSSKRVQVLKGNGFDLIKQQEKFDRIYFTAGTAHDFDPYQLIPHLNQGGIILCPLRADSNDYGSLMRYRLNSLGTLDIEEALDVKVAFVPLQT